MNWIGPGTTTHHHAWGGMVVSSNLPLPRLRETTAPADVDFRWKAAMGAIPEATREWAVRWVNGQQSIARSGRRGRVVSYGIDGLGTFAVDADAGEISFVQHDPETHPMRVEHTLVNAVLGLYAGLRGVVCLHAASVMMDDAATVVVGPSGAGKSTRAWEMIRAGGLLLADDSTVLRFEGSRWLAEPGAGTLRLRDLPHSDEGWDILGKREVTVPVSSGPAPVAEIVLLRGTMAEEDELVRSLCEMLGGWRLLVREERAILWSQLWDLAASVPIRAEPDWLDRRWISRVPATAPQAKAPTK